MSKFPDPSQIYPMPGQALTHIQPTVTRRTIETGDFTYYAAEHFESRVTHHYEFYGDRLVIGKFCQIAAGVEFVMNGANHRMNAVTTFPFNIFPDWSAPTPPISELPNKGDTVVGNDVWIGQHVVILPGVQIGDGAIIGANAVVGSDVEAYAIVAGNPARELRKRFDRELIALLLEFQWWNRPIQEIQSLIPLLTNSDLDCVKRELQARLRVE